MRTIARRIAFEVHWLEVPSGSMPGAVRDERKAALLAFVDASILTARVAGRADDGSVYEEIRRQIVATASPTLH